MPSYGADHDQSAMADSVPAETNPVAEGYQLLIAMQPGKAIRKLTAPLVDALRKNDKKRAARILRLIAFAFRLDENDTCAAQTALNALALDPESDEAKMDAAEYLFRCGKWKEGQDISLRLQSSKVPAIALLAMSQDSLRKIEFSKAIDAIKNAPEKVQANLRVMRVLALLYQMNEDFKSSSEVLKQLASACGSPYMKEIYLGRSCAVVMQFADAKKYFEAAGKIMPADPLWMSEIGIMEMKQSHIKEAREYLRKAVAQQRLSSQAHVNFALLEAYFGSTQEANAALKHISSLRPAGADVAFASGLVSEKLEDWQQAKESFARVLKLNPYNGSAYLHLLNIARREKIRKDELKVADDWLKMNPASFLARVECGKTYYLAGQKEKALASFDLAMKFGKERGLVERKNSKMLFLSLLAYRSSCNFDLGKTGAAFEDALLFNQRKPEPAKTGAVFIRPEKVEIGKLTAGSKQLEAVKHALIADVLYEVQEYSSADLQYKQAIDNDPDNILWHSCRLKVLIDQKNYVEAAKEDLYVSQHMVTHLPDVFGRR